MEQLAIYGPTGSFFAPIFVVSLITFVVATLLVVVEGYTDTPSIARPQKPMWIIGLAIGAVLLVKFIQKMIGFAAFFAGISLLAWLVFESLFDGDQKGILSRIFIQFIPVWIGMIVIFAVSIFTKHKTGLYGRLFDSTVGMIGFGLVLFWVLTAIFADQIALFTPLDQISGMKNKKPGWPVVDQEGSYYLLGGDALARDVFSRHGSLLPCQPCAGLSGDPALLPAGHPGDPLHWHPGLSGRGPLPLPDHLSGGADPNQTLDPTGQDVVLALNRAGLGLLGLFGAGL